MEEIIHYRFVKEEFTKHEQVIVAGVDPAMDWADIEKPSEKTITTRVELVNKKISVDELKKAMSADEGVTIDRNTIIVSEDSTKNTISLKIYRFGKTFVRTPKSKKENSSLW